MPPWVLLDVSYLAYRAWYTMGGLEYEGTPTGIVYGVLEQMRRICSNPHVASNRVVACFDSRQSIRRRDFQWYKKPRQQTERTPEDWANLLEFKKQAEVLRSEVFPQVGIQTLRQTGLESDDIMAKAAYQLSNSPSDQKSLLSSIRGVIVTSDSDLLQCISNRVHLFNPAKEEYLVWGDIVQRYGITPPQWAWVKALAGCDSDSVPGVPGIGEKTALDWLTGRLSPDSKKWKVLASDETVRLVDRNCLLVRLPHTRTRPVELKEPGYDGGKGFFKLCSRFGFKSYLGSRRGEWERFFAGTMVHTWAHKCPDLRRRCRG